MRPTIDDIFERVEHIRSKMDAEPWRVDEIENEISAAAQGNPWLVEDLDYLYEGWQINDFQKLADELYFYY
jgi:hypothetical protein